MTEFQELVKDAPKFVSMERGELVAYAYVMYAAGARTDAENAKLRELCAGLLTGYECGHGELCKGCALDGIGDSKTFSCLLRVKARELGVGVDE